MYPIKALDLIIKELDRLRGDMLKEKKNGIKRPSKTEQEKSDAKTKKQETKMLQYYENWLASTMMRQNIGCIPIMDTYCLVRSFKKKYLSDKDMLARFREAFDQHPNDRDAMISYIMEVFNCLEVWEQNKFPYMELSSTPNGPLLFPTWEAFVAHIQSLMDGKFPEQDIMKLCNMLVAEYQQKNSKKEKNPRADKEQTKQSLYNQQLRIMKNKMVQLQQYDYYWPKENKNFCIVRDPKPLPLSVPNLHLCLATLDSNYNSGDSFAQALLHALKNPKDAKIKFKLELRNSVYTKR